MYKGWNPIKSNQPSCLFKGKLKLIMAWIKTISQLKFLRIFDKWKNRWNKFIWKRASYSLVMVNTDSFNTFCVKPCILLVTTSNFSSLIFLFYYVLLDLTVVIHEALCFDVAQGQMNGAPNETRTHSCRFASLVC